MFKYETHLHTAEASGCASSTGAQMAEQYKAAGYTGIIVTDHFFNGNTAVPQSLDWQERVELYCRGYENALVRGREIGLDVFFGMEYGDGCSDFLVYGVDKEWLKKNDHIIEIGTESFLKYARSQGFIVIQAHPFRERDYIFSTLHAPRLTDGVEIVNHGQNDECNRRAEIYAQWYGLPVTEGSDAHNSGAAAKGGGILSPVRFSSALDYGRAVVNGSIRLCSRSEKSDN